MERHTLEDDRITWRLLVALRKTTTSYRLELLRLIEQGLGEPDGTENKTIKPAS